MSTFSNLSGPYRGYANNIPRLSNMNFSNLGGPFLGVSLPQNSTNYRDHESVTTRNKLKNSWNKQLDQINGRHRVLTPFRAVNNAGDFLARKDYVCGGPQINTNKPGYGPLMGKILSHCDNSGVPGASCNPKFVYDSSDYTTFKKQNAIAKTYNNPKA